MNDFFKDLKFIGKIYGENHRLLNFVKTLWLSAVVVLIGIIDNKIGYSIIPENVWIFAVVISYLIIILFKLARIVREFQDSKTEFLFENTDQYKRIQKCADGELITSFKLGVKNHSLSTINNIKVAINFIKYIEGDYLHYHDLPLKHVNTRVNATERVLLSPKDTEYFWLATHIIPADKYKIPKLRFEDKFYGAGKFEMKVTMSGDSIEPQSAIITFLLDKNDGSLDCYMSKNLK